MFFLPTFLKQNYEFHVYVLVLSKTNAFQTNPNVFVIEDLSENTNLNFSSLASAPRYVLLETQSKQRELPVCLAPVHPTYLG